MNLLQSLNKHQKMAVLHGRGPLLVVAGAGTGKTKVITHRISHLINLGIEANQILGVTFTNKASQEMKNRVLGLASAGPTIGTFHALSADILRKYGRYLGISSRFSILNEKECLNIIQSSIEELGLDLRQFHSEAIRNLISQKKSGVQNQEMFSLKNDDFFPKNLNLIQKNYEEHLKKQEALDFDDLIQKTLLLFEEFPEILKIYQNKWPYIHIDEYQDTDNNQARLIKLLAQNSQNICAVGDEDQSIYGFRGADFRNILNFEKNWFNTEIITLERNYRSTRRILDAANAIIVKNKFRREKNLFTKEKIGEKLTAYEAKDEIDEANFAAEKIKQLLQKGKLPSSIAILCRANFQFPAFEKSLAEHSLLYQTLSQQDSLVDKETIRLMTVHAAKGLEFKYVFIPGLEKRLFPYIENEEERRLFYVALTRAQEKIFLSWSHYRSVFGFKQINQPSPFLSDIPENLIKWG